MKHLPRKTFLTTSLLALTGAAYAQPKPNPVALANPLVGPDPYRGATAAGALRPFPLVRLGPDTLRPSTSGYNST